MNQEEQTTEVRETADQQGSTTVQRTTVSRDDTVSPSVLLQRVVYYITGFIIVFLAGRIILQLLGANQGNAFVDFVYSVGGFFAAPFYGIFGYEPAYGNSVFEISSVVAIFVYLIVGIAIAKLVTIGKKSA